MYHRKLELNDTQTPIGGLTLTRLIPPPSVSRSFSSYLNFIPDHLSSCPPHPDRLVLSRSVLGAEGLHGLQQVQGQVALGVVLGQDFNQTADKPAGLWQGHQGAPQLTGILQQTLICIGHKQKPSTDLKVNFSTSSTATAN